MQFTTTVTQKGQITLPKILRDLLKISAYDQVVISLEKRAIKVVSSQDVLDLAGTVKLTKAKKSVLDARKVFEKEYKRF